MWVGTWCPSRLAVDIGRSSGVEKGHNPTPLSYRKFGFGPSPKCTAHKPHTTPHGEKIGTLVVSFPRRLPAALCNLTSSSQSHETQSQLAQGASPKIPRLLTVSARFRCALVTGHGLATARNDERVESSKSKSTVKCDATHCCGQLGQPSSGPGTKVVEPLNSVP